MPYINHSKKPLPFTTLLDMKTMKCGLRGTFFSPTGNEYTGEWLDDKKHGKGTQIWKKSGAMYSGEWRDGKPDGYGIFSVLLPQTKAYAKKYCGGWKNGKKHGYGTYFYNNSAVYEGDWIEGLRSGWGRMYYENRDIYEGEWLKNKNHGEGILCHANGNWYEGTWLEGKKNGNGKFYYCKKGQLYEGLWMDGEAKCGTMSDFGRDGAPTPTKYPIPQLYLADIQLVIKEAQSTNWCTKLSVDSKFPLQPPLTQHDKDNKHQGKEETWNKVKYHGTCTLTINPLIAEQPLFGP